MYKIIVRMDRRPLKTLAIVTLALFLLFPAGSAAREIPLPGEEAATALFDAELEDAEVDFFIQGNWTANLSGGFGRRAGTQRYSHSGGRCLPMEGRSSVFRPVPPVR